MKLFSFALGVIFLASSFIMGAPASSNAENATKSSPQLAKKEGGVNKNATAVAPSSNSTSANKEIKVVIAENHFELELYGMHAPATDQDIHNVATTLWNKFAPLVPANEQTVYGVAVAADDMGGKGDMGGKDGKGDKFEYWVASPFEANKPMPAGLEKITIPSGLYAKIYLDSYDDLSKAYTYLMTTWPTTQNEYKFDLKRPCIERYNDFKKHGKKVELLCAVEKTGVAEKSANASAPASAGAVNPEVKPAAAGEMKPEAKIEEKSGVKPEEKKASANATQPESAEKAKAEGPAKK